MKQVQITPSVAIRLCLVALPALVLASICPGATAQSPAGSFHLGPVYVYPEVEFAVRRDDNIALQPDADRVADTIKYVRPALRFDAKSGTHYYDAGYKGEFARYRTDRTSFSWPARACCTRFSAGSSSAPNTWAVRAIRTATISTTSATRPRCSRASRFEMRGPAFERPARRAPRGLNRKLPRIRSPASAVPEWPDFSFGVTRLRRISLH